MFYSDRLKRIQNHIIIIFILCTIILLAKYFNFLTSGLIVKYSLYLIIIYILTVLIIFSRSYVEKYLSVPINPELMPLVRILYGLFCLYSAIQHLSLVPYGIEPYNFLLWDINTPSSLVYLIYTIHLLAIIFIILGYKIRWSWIILFVTGGAVIPFSLEIFVKNIFNFYAMFIPVHIWYGTNNNKTKAYNGWPLLLMGISYSILMSTAGLFKVLDPVWQEGLGLYYSLNIPFFAPRYLWWILDYEILMKALNWLTLIFELLALPLILFKRTRFYALITLVGLGLFLSFIMEGIGIMGGPIILIACLAVLALTKYPIILRKYMPAVFYFKLNCTKLKDKSFSPLWLGVLVFWWTINGFYVNFYQHSRNKLRFYPPKYGNYNVNLKPLLSKQSNVLLPIDYLEEILKPFRPPKEWEFVWTLELFDYHHLFDRVYFRIIFPDNKDGYDEPVVFFDEDGAISWQQPLPGNEKFLLTAFRLMNELRTEQFKDKGIVSNAMTNELRGMVFYCLDKSKRDYKEFKSATVQIKQIFQPYKFQGNSKPWKNNEWLDFYEYNFRLKEGKIKSDFPKYDYSRLKIDAFENKIIEPNF